jgi:AcrR family transcriptional regulator
MSARLEKKNPAASLRRGRPRKLELGQVIDAALAVGLQQLTMAAVAERLGVAKAVLYGYVANREELIRVATAHAARRLQYPEDHGQPWSTWILEDARALYEVMTMDGELLETWLNGGQSPHVEIDAGETWLRAMTSRGFSGEEALQLRRAVAHLVIGAAAASKRERALHVQGRPRGVTIKQAVANRAPEETPLLRQFLDVFAREVTEHNWEYSLYVLLRGVMAARDVLALRDGDSQLPFEERPPLEMPPPFSR